MPTTTEAILEHHRQELEALRLETRQRTQGFDDNRLVDAVAHNVAIGELGFEMAEEPALRCIRGTLRLMLEQGGVSEVDPDGLSHTQTPEWVIRREELMREFITRVAPQMGERLGLEITVTEAAS